jgi:hypothetical protein
MRVHAYSWKLTLVRRQAMLKRLYAEMLQVRLILSLIANHGLLLQLLTSCRIRLLDPDPTTTFRSCTLHVVESQKHARVNLSLALPLVVFLLLCLTTLGLLWKRRMDRLKWIQRKSRYFDDDAFVVNGERLELIEDDGPLDLPPVD